jgi:cholesterol oxidase
MVSSPLGELKPRYDVVVVGSGYGGGVAARRMAERRDCRTGQRALSVCVLERGLEWRAGDFPSSLSTAVRELQTHTSRFHVGSRTGLFDLRLDDDMTVLVGCGLGGTSLINANVMIRPAPCIFETPEWPNRKWNEELDPYYRLVEMELNAQQCPDKPAPLKVQRFFKAGARATPPSPQHTLAKLAVSFESRVDTATGVEERRCVMCGDCVTGCNHGAKNTIDRNYLAAARLYGAEIFCGVIVRTIEKVQDGERTEWLLHVQPNNRAWRLFGSRHTLLVRAGSVFLAAGTLGSTEILFRSTRAHGLPLSPRLGDRFSGNGDVIAFSYDGLEEVNAFGYGSALPLAPDVGPCITGILDERHGDPHQPALIIEDASVPGALAPLIRVAAPLISRWTRLRNGLAHDLSLGHIGRELITLIKGVHFGAVARTQLFLVMARDGATTGTTAGRLRFVDRLDRVRVVWPAIGSAPLFRDINRRLTQLTRGFLGRFVANPIWASPFGKRLLTVHPLGGCVMGDDATKGVVDHLGQVFDGSANGGRPTVHEGLFVCDGAIVPTSLGANPALTIAALAERMAERVQPPSGPSAPPKQARLSDATVPGLRYTERLTGQIKLEGNSSDIELLLHISTDDVEHLLTDAWHRADIVGAANTPGLPPSPENRDRTRWTITQSSLYVLIEDPRQVDTTLLLYRLTLTSPSGERLYIRGHKTINLQNCRKSTWKAITGFPFIVLTQSHAEKEDTAFKTLRPGEPLKILLDNVAALDGKPTADSEPPKPPVEGSVGSGKVANSVADAVRFVLSFDVVKEPQWSRRVGWIVRFDWFFVRAVIEARIWLVRRTRRPDAFNRPDPGKLPKFTNRFCDQKNGRLPRYQLTQFDPPPGTYGEDGPKPVLVSPGYGMSSDCFLVGTLQDGQSQGPRDRPHGVEPHSFVNYLLKRGYQVWLLDYRASDHLEISLTQYTFDDLVPDFEAALAKVYNKTHKKKIRIVAHCVGSMVTSMLLLTKGRDLEHMIQSVVLSQSFPFMDHPWTNRLKSALRLPLLLKLVRFNPVLNTDDDLRAGWMSRALDLILRLYPTREHCSSSVCRRIIFVYGEVVRHEQLDRDTHDMLFDLFDRTNLTMFEHVARMILRGKIVDHYGRDVYVRPENARRNITRPVTLIQGKQNRFFRPAGGRKTEAWFNCYAPGMVTLREIRNYGHLDHFIGKNAEEDVFGAVRDGMERPQPMTIGDSMASGASTTSPDS